MNVLATLDLYHDTDPKCWLGREVRSAADAVVDCATAEERGLDPCPECFPERAGW